MRHLGLLLGLAACHRAAATATPPANQHPPPRPVRTIAIVEDGVGVVLLDGGVVPRSRFLATTSTRQLGPYLHDESSAVDLRDPTGPIAGIELSEDAQLGEGAYGEVIADEVDGGLDVSIEGEHHVVPWPAGQHFGFALSPDGTTAVVAARALYTLDTRAAAFVELDRPTENLGVAFLDDRTLIASRDVTGVDFTLRSLADAPDRDLTLADGWTTTSLDDLPITAPRVPVMREEKFQSGLYDLATGDVLAYPISDRVLAVSPDGSAAVTTTPCGVTGGLTRISATGAQVLRPSPDDTACAEQQELPATPVSAVFDADGALVTAMPAGNGWQIAIDGRVVRTSANAMRVFAY